MSKNVPVFDKKDVDENKYLAGLSYLGLFFLLPLLLKKNSPFAQAHAKQGLVLCVAIFLVSIINIIPFFGQVMWFFAVIFFIVLSAVAFLRTIKGDFWEIPYLSEYAKKIKL